MPENNSGFTLVEMLMAMLVFTVVMLFGFSFFEFGRKAISKAEKKEIAIEIASGKLETAKAGLYGLIVNESNSEIIEGCTYYCQLTVTDNVSYKIIQETVTWINGSVGLTTIIAEN